MKLEINNTKFLNKKDEINHKDVVTISSEGQWIESKTFKKEDGSVSNQFDINITLPDGEERSTTLNWSNIKLLALAYGKETKEWVGKKVKAWKTKSEKAKLGFTYVYVPTDWERDETGEWIIPTHYTQYPDKFTSAKEQQAGEEIDYPTDEINSEEIPF